MRGKGIRHAVGELITCPFCTAQWVATAYAAGLVFAPHATRLAGATMTAVVARTGCNSRTHASSSPPKADSSRGPKVPLLYVCPS